MSASIRKIKTKRQESDWMILMKNSQKRLRFFLLSAGIILTVVGFLLSSKSSVPIAAEKPPSSESSNVESFSQEPVKIDKNLLNIPVQKDKPNKQIPVRIIIPGSGIDLPVKEARIVKGYWEVFSDTAGFGEGSAYLDETGNTVIFAHARPGLFLPLKDVKSGQEIYVLSKEKWFSYKITDIKEVFPSQTEVIAPSREAILTLYTCSGFADNKRLIVKAVRI